MKAVSHPEAATLFVIPNERSLRHPERAKRGGILLRAGSPPRSLVALLVRDDGNCHPERMRGILLRGSTLPRSLVASLLGTTISAMLLGTTIYATPLGTTIYAALHTFSISSVSLSKKRSLEKSSS